MLSSQATTRFEELAAGATMRAAHRFKLAVAQLKADAADQGTGLTKRTVAEMDGAGVQAIDALVSELLAQVDRVHASEASHDARERAAQLQNLFEAALREGGQALVSVRDESARPVLQRLGVQLPSAQMLERLEAGVRDGRARIRLAVTTRAP